MVNLFRADKGDIEFCFGGILADLLKNTRMEVSDGFVQHGDTSVLLHSVAVAYYGFKLLRKLRLTRFHRELVRGALLHDYFLYDWHKHDNGRRLHGFSHPFTALENARRDTKVSPLEAEIIARHMFPLTPTPPKSGAAWIICLVDKACSVYETFNRRIYPELRNYIDRCRAMTLRRGAIAA